MQSLQGTSEIFQKFPPNLIFLNVKLVIGFVLDRHSQLNNIHSLTNIKHLKSNVLIRVFLVMGWLPFGHKKYGRKAQSSYYTSCAFGRHWSSSIWLRYCLPLLLGDNKTMILTTIHILVTRVLLREGRLFQNG